MNIRKANSGDFNAVLSLVEELEAQVFDKNKFESIYLSNLENPSICYFCLEKDKKVIGLISVYFNQLLHHCEIIAEIQELIVKAEFRNKKYGHQLIQHVEDFVKTKGVNQIELCSNQKRLKAHNFYLRQGYKRSHFKFVKSI